MLAIKHAQDVLHLPPPLTHILDYTLPYFTTIDIAIYVLTPLVYMAVNPSYLRVISVSSTFVVCYTLRVLARRLVNFFIVMRYFIFFCVISRGNFKCICVFLFTFCNQG